MMCATPYPRDESCPVPPPRVTRIGHPLIELPETPYLIPCTPEGPRTRMVVHSASDKTTASAKSRCSTEVASCSRPRRHKRSHCSLKQLRELLLLIAKHR